MFGLSLLDLMGSESLEFLRVLRLNLSESRLKGSLRSFGSAREGLELGFLG